MDEPRGLKLFNESFPLENKIPFRFFILFTERYYGWEGDTLYNQEQTILFKYHI